MSSSPSKRKRHDEAADLESDSDSSGEQSPRSSSISPATHSDDNDSGPAVEVLSHAEKRRQKKKQKLVVDENSPSEPKKSSHSSDKTKGSEANKRQNSVWVGNLSFRTTPESLKAFFDGVGEITRVHMPMKLASSRGAPGERGPQKENRGFAYVDFSTPDARSIAVSLSEKNLDGRRLLIKSGEDFAGRPLPSTTEGDGTSTPGISNSNATLKSGLTKMAQKILSVQKQPPCPVLFLGNLSFSTTVSSVVELFTAHHKKANLDKKKKSSTSEGIDDDEEGKEPEADVKPEDVGIKKVRMGEFEDTGKCKGFGFVDFITTEQATAVLTNPRNHRLDGRDIVVEYASPDAVRRGGYRMNAEKKGVKPREGGQRSSNSNPRERRQSQITKVSRVGVEENAEDGESKSFQQKGPDAAGLNDRRPRRTDDSSIARRRPKPGAALALAQKEKTAIVPSEGKRMTF